MKDELREARDLATPGARLEELFLGGDGWETSSSDAEVAVVLAAIGNPSMSLPALVSFLLLSEGDATEAYEHDLMVTAQRAAWHNPIVPTLLLSQPRADYLEAAALLLEQMTAASDRDLYDQTMGAVAASRDQMALTDATRAFSAFPSLEAFLAAWAAMPDGPDAHGHPALPQSCRDTARHLAALLGLPWPEP